MSRRPRSPWLNAVAGLVVLACALAGSARAEDGGAVAEPEIRREIRLRVACDEEWRSQRNWERMARRLVSKASALFEKPFGIRWTVTDVVPWTSNDDAEALGDLLVQVRDTVPRTGVDVCLGFSGQEKRKGSAAPYRLLGTAYYYGPAAVFRSTSTRHPEGDVAAALAHEFGHLLGAWHFTGTGSIMHESMRRDSAHRFDPVSAAAILLARDIDFGRGVRWLDDSRRRRIAVLFRTMHVPGELVPHVSVTSADARTAYRADPAEGRRLYRLCLAEQEASAGPDDLGVVSCLANLAWAETYGAGRDLDEAERLARRAMAFDLSKECLEEPVPTPQSQLADVLWEKGRREEALAMYAAACASLEKRRPAGHADRSAAEERLRSRRAEAPALGGPSALHEIGITLPAAVAPGTPEGDFEKPATGFLNVRRAPLAGDQATPMNESIQVACPVAGTLTIAVSEVDRKGDVAHAVRMTIAVAAATRERASAFAVLSFERQKEASRDPEFAGYGGALRLWAGDEFVSETSFRFVAPVRAPWRIDRMRPVGRGAFSALPWRMSSFHALQWAGATSASLSVAADGAVVVDGARVEPDGTGALHTWRIELTFEPDAPK